MTISQPSSSQGSKLFAGVSLGRILPLALARWRERRRAKADLARLADAGDYLLLDIGLDPKVVRENPGALLDQITHDCR